MNRQRYEDVQMNMECYAKHCDDFTRLMHEGRLLLTGEILERPHRGRPMFVGLLLTGFGGDWITQGNCWKCGAHHEIGRCAWCHAAICQDLSGPKSVFLRFAICGSIVRFNRRFTSSDSNRAIPHRNTNISFCESLRF